MMSKSTFFVLLLSLSVTQAFVIPKLASRGVSSCLHEQDPIISPFDTSGDEASGSAVATETLEGPLELTWENVEKVLDEMRPYLIQDGGNVAITEIDGPVVRLELQVRK